jgi:hypothetical protein
VNNWTAILAGILCASFVAGCGRKPDAPKPLAGPPESGALYSLSDNEGGFRAGKVLAAEDEVVFVLLFAERWTERPALATGRKAAGVTNSAIGIAYSAQSFRDLRPVHLEAGKVTEADQDRFEEWKQSKREVF